MSYRKLIVKFETGDTVTYDYDTGLVHSFIERVIFNESIYAPAVLSNKGDSIYFKQGRIHNDAGPAFIGRNDRLEYWLDGVEYSYDQWDKLRLK